MAIKQGVKIIFHLGVDTSITTKQQEELDREIHDNDDILQQNFIDNYQNLTSMNYLLDCFINFYVVVKSAFMLEKVNNFFHHKHNHSSYLVKGNCTLSNKYMVTVTYLISN